MLQLLITRSEKRGRGEPGGGGEGKHTHTHTHTHTQKCSLKKKEPLTQVLWDPGPHSERSENRVRHVCDLRPQSSSVPHNYLIQHSPCQIQ